MMGQQFNGNKISGGSFIINYYGLTEQEAKQALTEYTNKQLQNALQTLFKERWRVFFSPFQLSWTWAFFATFPIFLISIHYSTVLFDLFASINNDPLALISWILLVSASIFGVFFFLWHYTTNKMKPDIEAINQLLRQNWNMKRWIDEELQVRKLRLWKRKCGVKDELKDYMGSENNEQDK